MNIPDELLDELLNTVEWCFIMDEGTGQVLYANQNFLEACGPRILTEPYAAALADSPLQALFCPQLDQEDFLEWELAITETNSYYMVRNRWLERNHHTYRIGIISSSSDIVGLTLELSRMTADYQKLTAENERLIDNLQWNAYHDQLTGLFNRNRYMNDSPSLEGEQGLGIINVDINCLKTINDCYGHSEGDWAIKTAADAIRLLEEEGRTCCYRLGGDEFLVVFKNCTDDYLKAAMAQISGYIGSQNTETRPFVLEAALGAALQEPGQSFPNSKNRQTPGCTRTKRKAKNLRAFDGTELLRNPINYSHAESGMAVSQSPITCRTALLSASPSPS